MANLSPISYVSPRGTLCYRNQNEEFSKISSEISSHTLVDAGRQYILFQFLKQTRNLNGDVAELGVYRGGTAKLIAKTSFPTTTHLFDTFTGLPEIGAKDSAVYQFKGRFAEPENKVRQYLSDCPNVKIYPGLFPETTSSVENVKFRFAHIDADLYQSVLDACSFFYPRLVPGGIMIFDDYGYTSCPGCKIAIDEFFAGKSEQPIYLEDTGQCVVIKLGV